MIWWQWAVLGLLLAAAEILTPGGFFVIFFGVAALVIAALAAVGLAGALWLQILLFSVFSVILLLLFRNPLLRWMAKRVPARPEVDTLVGESAVASGTIAPGGHGAGGTPRATVWSARNASPAAIAAGGRCRVVRVEGLVIWIEPE